MDINFGCPIDHFTRKGLGASVGRHPNRIRRLVEAMKRAVTRIPVTAKIRLGWNDTERNYLQQARAAVDGGADAIFVHGRTRNARYRFAADWDAIGEIAAAVTVPVIGNGDLLFPHEIDAARSRSGCAAVMVARAALIKPWIFGEARDGYRDISGDERLDDLSPIRRAGARALGRRRTRARARADLHAVAPRFLVPLRASSRRRHVSDDAGTDVAVSFVRTPLEALLARNDAAAWDYLTERLTLNEDDSIRRRRHRHVESDHATPSRALEVEG